MSISSVSNNPQLYTHAWGPIVFGCVSTNINAIDFSYVFDVYQNPSNPVKIARIFQPPNPQGTGILDIQSIVQPYIIVGNSIDFEVANAMGATATFFNPTTEYGSYYVMVGEQYRTAIGGPLQLFKGTSGAPGDPDYYIGNRYLDQFPGSHTLKATGLTVGVIVLPAAADTDIAYSQENLSPSLYPLGLFSPYTMPSSYNNVPIGMTFGLGQWLTQGGTVSVVSSQDQATLTYINFNPTIGLTGGTGWDPYQSGYNSWPAAVLTTFYGPTGSLGSTVSYNLVSNGGGGFTSTNQFCTGPTFSFKNVYQYNLMAINTSPVCYSFPAGTNSYSIKLLGPTCSGSIQLSEEYYYYLRDQTSDQYPRIRFSWLNKLGGRDYFNFTEYYAKNDVQAPNVYYRDANNWSSAVWNLTPWKAGDTSYSKALNSSIKVTTGWLNEDQITFLKSLFDSPSIHVWLDSSTTYPTPCLITSSMPTRMKQLLSKDKLQQITFTFQTSTVSRSQTN